MGLILKHTLKSMWAHKGRTFILLLSIALCSFAAMMSFGMSGTIDTALRSAYNAAFGTADILVTSFSDLRDDITEGLPEHTAAKQLTGSTSFTEHIPGYYNIIRSRNYSIVGVNDDMKRLGLIQNDIELGELEASVPGALADTLGLEEGSTLTLYSKKKEPFDFTVKRIERDANNSILFGDRILVSENSIRLMDGENAGFRMMYIDVLDNTRITEAKEILERNAPGASADVLLGDESTQQIIEYLTNILLAMFAVLLLLVLFVTISSSQRIITDKMPVIGTFRSLGIPSAMTYTVLLGENALYGLVGSLIGVLLDSVARPAMVNITFAPANSDGSIMELDTASTSPLLILAVICGAMLIECLCPIKEILLAVKTPIRDIIFSNKDTQYKHSRASAITGIVMAVIGVALLFVPDNFLALLISFIFSATAMALLYPYVLRFVSGLLARLYGRLNMPAAQLAATEVRQRKSTVGSAVLCFSASAIAIVIYIFASAFGETFSRSLTDADMLVWVQNDTERNTVSFVEDIDGVTETEYIYSSIDSVMINGEPADMQTVVDGVPEDGYRLYKGSAGIPADLGYEEVVFTQVLADKYGLKTGDAVEIRFKSEMFMPVTKKLTVRGTGLMSYTDSSSRMLAVSEKLYKEIYKDFPMMILARCSSPAAAVNTVLDHSAGCIIEAKTNAQNEADNARDTASLMTVINFLIFFAVGMTFIGVAGNQLIGFEGRRRECAVLISTSMTRGQLAKMFLLESFFAAGISLISAAPAALLLAALFRKITASLMLSLPETDSAGAAITLGLILWAVFTAAAEFPISRMKKMNIAGQLKYE